MLSSAPSSATTSSSPPSESSLPAALRPRPDQREQWLRHASPVSFDRAAEEVVGFHRMDGARTDVVTADLRAWAFGSGDGRTMQLVGVPFFGRETSPPYGLRQLAFQQLAGKVGAPASYLAELPAKLQIANLNYAITRRSQPAMLRLAGSEIRAVLSERYAPVDDHVLFELVTEALDHAGLRSDALVRATAVGTSTVLRVTLPGEGVAVKRGDIIEYGIDLGNSEVGLRSVQVVPTTYRLLCSNGMRGWQSEAASKFRHVGAPERLRELLRDALPLAFAEARGDLARWKRSLDVLVDDAFAEVEALRGFGLTGAEIDAVGRALLVDEGVDLSGRDARDVEEALRGRRSDVFHVANAITATAKARPVASRLSLEESAHRFLVRRTA